jgi:glycosyltransferase involved in cell wall biosynthesis
MNALRILLISSVLPQDTTGGEVVLYRHLSRWSELRLAIASEESENLLTKDILQLKANPLLTRLTKTKLSRWAHDVRQCLNAFYNTNQVRHYINKHGKPDLILTVAHGELCWLAQQISQEFNIPLVTFFHDWWPDLAYVHTWAREVLTNRFKQLYQQSSLAFCVSQDIRQALGTHPNAQILFPIPTESVSEKSLTTLTRQESFRVIYAGTLSDIYGSMIQALCNSFQGIPSIQLKLFGPQPDWPDLLVQQIKADGIYGGFISRDLLVDELGKANALLVALSFNQPDQMRMQTSFPSKLLEYCQFGKPIIIWGPEDCSAVRWGRKHQSALVVTSSLAQDLVKAIQELATQPEEQIRLVNKALEMAQGMFNPEKIQQQFVESLHQVAAK